MAYLEPLDPPQRPSIPYRRVKRHAHRGLLVAIAIGVMAASAGALLVGYKISTRQTGGGDVPVLRADTQPIKLKPADPGGMEIPNRDRLVFNQKASETTERLLPPPEAPMARPTPPPEASAPAAPPPPAVAAQPAPAPVAPAAPPTQAQAAPPPQSAALPPALSGTAIGKGYRLQLGSVKTQDGATQEWGRIKRQNTDLLGALSFSAERADLGDRGVFFRVLAGPLADGAEADRICGALRQRNVGCLLVKP
jgi:hypothetical protein